MLSYHIKFDNEYFNQLTQLVQLFESSVLNDIRILLLNPISNIYLVKTLYGIMMLLPQGKAFNALNERLKSIDVLIKLESKNTSCYNTQSSKDLNDVKKETVKNRINVDFYLNEFDKVYNKQ